MIEESTKTSNINNNANNSNYANTLLTKREFTHIGINIKQQNENNELVIFFVISIK